jgi:hypothetical protein
MTKKRIPNRFWAPVLALAALTSASPAMAQSAQPSNKLIIAINPVQILIGLLLPAVQKVR